MAEGLAPRLLPAQTTGDEHHGGNDVWHLNIESYQSNLEHGSADAGEISGIAVFLDFDPVLPGWPPDGDDEKVFDAVARAEGSALAERSIINANDLRRLTAMIRAARAPARAGCCVNALERRLQRATLVTPWEIPPDAVTMNSRVRVRDVESRTRRKSSPSFTRVTTAPRKASVCACSIRWVLNCWESGWGMSSTAASAGACGGFV